MQHLRNMSKWKQQKHRHQKNKDSKHTATKARNSNDQEQPSQLEAANIEIHSIKIQKDFDKKAILPPVAVWNRVLDRSAFLISALRITIKRKGIFFDRELASGFYTCILNQRGYLVVYTQPLGNEGYAVNLRKASKIVFKMVNVGAIAKQQNTDQSAQLQVSNARGWYCKMSVKWEFGSMTINLPDRQMVEWCNSTLFAAVDDTLLLAQLPQGGPLRPSTDAATQVGTTAEEHQQSNEPERLLDEPQGKAEVPSDGFEEVLLENDDNTAVNKPENMDGAPDGTDAGPIETSNIVHLLDQNDENNNHEDRVEPDFWHECEGEHINTIPTAPTQSSIYEWKKKGDNNTVTEEDGNKQVGIEDHEESNDTKEGTGRLSAQQLLLPRPILKRRVTFSDLKTIFKYQPSIDNDAPPMSIANQPENAEISKKPQETEDTSLLGVTFPDMKTIFKCQPSIDNDAPPMSIANQPENAKISKKPQGAESTSSDHNGQNEEEQTTATGSSIGKWIIALQFPFHHSDVYNYDADEDNSNDDSAVST